MNEKIGINLLRVGVGKREPFKGKRLKRLLYVTGIIASLVLIVSSIEIFIIGRIYRQQKEDLVGSMQEIGADIEDMKDEEVLYRGTIDKFIVARRLLAEKQTTALAFQAFLTLIPTDIAIETLEVSSKDFRAQLSTISLFSLESFLQELADEEKSGMFFQNIVTSSITQDVTGIVRLTIEAKVKE